MVGHASERRRHRSEVGDSPKKEETDEVTTPEERDRPEEVEPEVKESTESTGEVNLRVRKVMEDLEAKERNEESIPQRMERALGGLEDPEKSEKSTEQRLREALETQEEPVHDTESEVRDDSTENGLETSGGNSESKEELEQKVGDTELRPDSVNGDGKIKLESKEEVDKAIQQHPHVKNGLSPESYENCERYIRVISEEEDVSGKDIAERENLDEQVVESWREGVRPKGIHTIEDLETKRLEHEAMVPEEALEHRINPRDVREVTADALEKETLSVKELADIVHDIHQKIDNPELGSIRYAELYDSGKPLTEDRLRDIAVEIRANREAIQSELNTRLGLNDIPHHEVRIGVTDSRLYYWHINTSPDEWVNVLEDQKFYMSKENKAQLIDEMRAHLHIRGGGQTSEYYLNDLINQISGLENPAANRIRKYDSVYSLDGEVMHLIADLQGKSLEDFKDVITHMGTREAARVSNIQFPEIRKFRTRFVGIAESDCHLDEYGRLSYFETNEARMKIAIDFYQEFGDFEVRIDSSDEKRLVLPRLYGAMAEKWGIPMGDKAIRNQGLHETVKHARLEDKPYYPREMVPEDGCISGGVVSILRHNVLHAGENMEKYRTKYGIEPVVTQEHIQFVIDEAAPNKATLCYEDGDVIRLYLTKIRNIADDEKHRSSDIANDLIRIVNENKHQLLRDEVDCIMKPLGVEMNVRESFVQYYNDSQRLVLSSYGTTKTKDDAIRWVLIAPPNHPSKMKVAIELITDDERRSRRVAKEIEKDGLSINTMWEGYLK